MADSGWGPWAKTEGLSMPVTVYAVATVVRSATEMLVLATIIPVNGVSPLTRDAAVAAAWDEIVAGHPHLGDREKWPHRDASAAKLVIGGVG